MKLALTLLVQAPFRDSGNRAPTVVQNSYRLAWRRSRLVKTQTLWIRSAKRSSRFDRLLTSNALTLTSFSNRRPMTTSQVFCACHLHTTLTNLSHRLYRMISYWRFFLVQYLQSVSVLSRLSASRTFRPQLNVTKRTGLLLPTYLV